MTWGWTIHNHAILAFLMDYVMDISHNRTHESNQHVRVVPTADNQCQLGKEHWNRNNEITTYINFCCAQPHSGSHRLRKHHVSISNFSTSSHRKKKGAIGPQHLVKQSSNAPIYCRHFLLEETVLSNSCLPPSSSPGNLRHQSASSPRLILSLWHTTDHQSRAISLPETNKVDQNCNLSGDQHIVAINKSKIVHR